MPEPPPLRRQLPLERPDVRRRIAAVVASVLGVGLLAIAAIGFLVVWHLVRRGRLIRERLGPPRVVRLPETDTRPTDPERREPEPP